MDKPSVARTSRVFEFRYIWAVLAFVFCVVAAMLNRYPSTGVSVAHAPNTSYGIVTLALVGIAYAVGLAALYETLRMFSAGPVWAACVTLAAGVGTLLLPSASLLDNHVVGGALVLIGFRCLVEPGHNGRLIALGGAAIALAAAMDISSVIFVLLAPLLFVRRGSVWTLVPFVAAVVAIAALSAVFSRGPAGSFNSLNFTGLAVHRSLTDHLRYALDLGAGNHGVFTYLPVLVIAVYALLAAWIGAPAYRRGLAFIAVGCAAYVAASVWSSSDYSGYADGVRWYTGIVYLAMVPLAFIETAIVRSGVLRSLFVATTLLSTFIATVGLVDRAPANADGSPPFVHDLRLLFGGQHFPNDATCAVIVTIAALVLISLLTLMPRAAEGSAQRIWRPAAPAK